MRRSDFLISMLLASAAVPLPHYLLKERSLFRDPYISQRPAPEDRKFSSEAVEAVIEDMKTAIADEELAWMFENCFPNTLDTTVDFEYIDGKPDTFVITGDIDAMWLRDSTAQVWPYMPLMSEDEKLRELIKGLINRQMKCILLDPYANAFYKDTSRESYWKEDSAQMLPGVHERKWEIDSLCYPIRLSNEYYKLTEDASIFDEQWVRAMRLVVETLCTEQRKDGTTPYRFGRKTTVMIDSPPFNGTGRPVKPNGMICSAFRPSDDSTNLPYLIPSNLFALVSLEQLSDIFSAEVKDPEMAAECSAFASELRASLQNEAIYDHLDFGRIYAYEIDGFGNKLFMDDANVPSLMSLPYIGAVDRNDPVYENTRRFLLSDDNPYFLKGEAASGQGSPHTGKDSIWPMGIVLRAMTSEDPDEIRTCIAMLKATHADTGFMHESFLKDDSTKYTRDWFAWANTLFGEMMLNVRQSYPEILREKY